jgi:Tfp pilus assembly protein FimV
MPFTLLMNNKARRYMKFICQLWMISVTGIFMSNATALVLGDIQVLSHLGQPLKAKIALFDLSDTDALHFKTRLADAESYKVTELQYPDGHKFSFQLVNEPGKQPFIRVLTAHPLDAPFINLLIETTSDSGKFIKAYTFLLDPSPSWQQDSTNAVQPLPTQSAQPALHQTQPAGASNGPAIADKPAKPASKRKKDKRMMAAAPSLSAAPPATAMKLAMSLSISSHDPAADASTDALHEELIAREKTLEDLNAQLGAMQAAIKSLQDRLQLTSQLSVDTVSGVQPSNAAASGVLNAEQKTVKLQTPSPSAQPLPETFLEANRLALALLALLLAVAGLVWYRRSQDGKKNPFDDPDENSDTPLMPQYQLKEMMQPVQTSALTGKTVAPATSSFTTEKAATPVAAPLPAMQQQLAAAPEQLTAEAVEQPVTDPRTIEGKVWPFDEQSVEVSPHDEQISASIVPPEYAMLLEAKKHLRSADDALAEKVLIKAIRANPKNTHVYLVLLSIYEKRGDKDSFSALALRLKDIGDESSYAEAAEMGRKLDPDNPLYA